MTQAKITITRTRRGIGFPDTQRYVKRAAAAALKAEGVTVPCELDVTLTDDAVIHTINREQRGVDRATDVLSFPMNELTPGAFNPDACEWDYETERAMLGDMVISMERCAEQAGTYGHSFAHEVSYLTVHSVLHLLGYDHVTPEQERQMFGLQRQLLLTFFALRHDANVQATLPAGTPDALALYDAAHGAGRDLDSK